MAWVPTAADNASSLLMGSKHLLYTQSPIHYFEKQRQEEGGATSSAFLATTTQKTPSRTQGSRLSPTLKAFRDLYQTTPGLNISNVCKHSLGARVA